MTSNDPPSVHPLMMGDPSDHRTAARPAAVDPTIHDAAVSWALISFAFATIVLLTGFLLVRFLHTLVTDPSAALR